MRHGGGPYVAITFGPGGPLTAQLCTVDSPGGPVSFMGGGVESVTGLLGGPQNMDTKVAHKKLGTIFFA